jgi:alkylation response protein AidB-like acyl-CoA dehydrogenase
MATSVFDFEPDYRFDADHEAFRVELRAFLAETMAESATHADPADLTGLDESFERRLHRAAGERGWLDLEPAKQAVFAYEAARADAPLLDTAMVLAGHAIARFASPALRQRLLPRMRAGTITFCSAYTEAAAGSDLSRLEASAVPREDGWVLSGTKVLVTGAHKADWCCTVARTRADVPARDGLSMFAVDMRRPGVEVVRTPTMNCWSLGEIRFHEVRLELEALLGERDRGWRQMTSALAAERSGMAWLGFARRVFELLVEWVREHARSDAVARDRLGALAVELAAAERLGRRTLAALLEERDEPALPAMMKVVATELLQTLAQTASELCEEAGVLWAPLFGAAPPGAAAGGRFAYEYVERVHGTISVGPNELQRDAIARVLLGRSGDRGAVG